MARRSIDVHFPIVTIGLMALITAAAFALSYTALTNLAISAGISPDRAFLWPLCLDAFMIVASIDLVRKEMIGDSTRWSWIIVGIVTITSVIFNIIDAPHNLVSQMVYAAPPIVVFAAFEKVMGVVKSGIPATNNDRSDNPSRTGDQTRITIGNQPAGEIDAYLRDHPGVRVSQISKDLSIPRTTLTRHLSRLVSVGVICKVGSGYMVPG